MNVFVVSVPNEKERKSNMRKYPSALLLLLRWLTTVAHRGHAANKKVAANKITGKYAHAPF